MGKIKVLLESTAQFIIHPVIKQNPFQSLRRAPPFKRTLTVILIPGRLGSGFRGSHLCIIKSGNGYFG